MIWFAKKRIPYQPLIIEAINSAMSINIRDKKTFADCPTNNLESVVAIFWMFECSLHGLSRANLEKAGSHAMDALLEWVSNDYSREEMQRLVIPAFKNRLNEYSRLFVVKAGEAPGATLLRTFKRIVENVFGEDAATPASIATAVALWWNPISLYGAHITDLDKNNEVSW